VLKFRVKARVNVKIRARVRDSRSTKRLSTKRVGYEMSGSPWNSLPTELRHSDLTLGAFQRQLNKVLFSFM